MLTDKQKQSLDSYFGFAKRKKAIFVGMKMEEMIARKKSSFVLLLPSCSLKKEEELRHYSEKNPDLVFFRYQGSSYDIKEVLGYELLNALTITDCHLAKAIKEVLSEDMK